MTETPETNETCAVKSCCKKKAPFAILAAVIVAALAVGGYFSSRSTMETEMPSSGMESTDSTSAPALSAEKDIVIATVDNKDIKISEALNFINAIPQLKGQPLEAIFPMVQEQLVSSQVVGTLANQAGIENDPDVIERLALAKSEIIRAVFVERALEQAVTEETLKESYKDFLSKQPDVEEARARHILVEKESEAEAIIKALTDGGDFAELAKEKSTGPTGAKGGDLGYFTAKDMVPEFSTAAFSLKKGAVTEKPVKTQFGWHVIKLEDKRVRPAPSYTEVKPFLESEERKTVLNALLKTWKEGAEIEVFDIQGNEIEPASGE